MVKKLLFVLCVDYLFLLAIGQIRNVTRLSCDCGRREDDVIQYNTTKPKRLVFNGEDAENGSLINDQWILTAAHCVRTNTYVRLGANSRDSNGTVIKVAKSVPHPMYLKMTKANDIALLKLHNRVTFTKSVSPVCLPTLGMESFDKLFILGYGKNLKNTTKLQRADLLEIPWQTCNRRVQTNVTANNICTGGNQKSGCFGDSGGPLVYSVKSPNVPRNNFVVGISVWTHDNCKDITGFMRASKYYDWIHDTIAADTVPVGWCRNDGALVATM